LGRIDFAELREARPQAHYAAQWLARAARAYIPPWPDDGHTHSGWNDAFDGFIGHPLPGGTRLGLRLPDLTLALLDDNGKALHELALQGQREADVRMWLGKQAQALGLAPEQLDVPLPYALPPHPLAQGAPYEPAAIAPALSELAAWYANAQNALSIVRQGLLARGLQAPKVCCWPHHFDLDCLTVIGGGVAYVAPTMGAGFSPGDHYYEEPYFYISLYPRPERGALPVLPPPGHWHTDDFLAAVLPASRIVALRDPQAETEAFLKTAVDQAVKVLNTLPAARAN
jgi:hypothetical protein